jgi:hypothetical protein
LKKLLQSAFIALFILSLTIIAQAEELAIPASDETSVSAQTEEVPALTASAVYQEPAPQQPTYEEPTPSPEPAKRYVIELSGINLRKGPSVNYDVIKPIEYRSLLSLLEADSGADQQWSLVEFDGDTGYVKREYLGIDQPPEPPEKPKPALVVEHLTWGEVKGIFTIGVPAKVLDIRSGAVYYVKSFSNGSHADVEPVTKEDTAIMKRTYNNSWNWDGRPVWVTINGRTIAGAINGMPHGGGVNSSNGMSGQVCLHFYQSRVHNGNRSYERQLQAVVQESWNAAQ